VRVVPWGIDPAVFTDRELAPSTSAIRLCAVLTGNAAESKSVEQTLRLLSNSSESSSTTFASTVLNPSASSASEPSPRAEHLRSADLILFPEEDPSAESAALIVEAMSCGRPVVVPQNESTRYLLSDGVEGMMFEPAHPKHLSRVVHRLASDATLRRELGAAARRAAVRRFDWRMIIERGYRPILRHRVAHKIAT
jgi:glycosyltransferase involved in cell wall biosynthesis